VPCVCPSKMELRPTLSKIEGKDARRDFFLPNGISIQSASTNKMEATIEPETTVSTEPAEVVALNVVAAAVVAAAVVAPVVATAELAAVVAAELAAVVADELATVVTAELAPVVAEAAATNTLPIIPKVQ